MKKYAFILMGPGYQPETHQTMFQTGSTENYIFTVQNFQQAQELVKQLVSQGFGALEVCGAFGKERAQELFELTGKTVPVSYIITPAEQKELTNAFFSSGKKETL